MDDKIKPPWQRRIHQLAARWTNHAKEQQKATVLIMDDSLFSLGEAEKHLGTQFNIIRVRTLQYPKDDPRNMLNPEHIKQCKDRDHLNHETVIELDSVDDIAALIKEKKVDVIMSDFGMGMHDRKTCKNIALDGPDVLLALREKHGITKPAFIWTGGRDWDVQLTSSYQSLKKQFGEELPIFSKSAYEAISEHINTIHVPTPSANTR